MEKQPTIRTLAKMAGVSTATISLALRGNPRIRPEVRKRIQRIAFEVGYKADPLVANLLFQLRSKKKLAYQSTLGVVTLGKSYADLKSFETVRQWVEGCKERAGLLGYKIDHFSLIDAETTPQRLVKILNSRNIRGLLVIGSHLGYAVQTHIDPLWNDSAAVVIGVQPIHPRLSFTSNEQFSTTFTAINELLKLGYKRPGLCIWPQIDDWVKKRFSGGYYIGQDMLTSKNRIPKFDFEYGDERRFKTWVERHRPDAIMTLHPEILEWVKGTGLKVPDDIGIVHLDKHADLPWAGMQQNNEDVGRAAVDMVIGQLHRNEFGVPPLQKGVYITGSWMAGPTVRKHV